MALGISYSTFSLARALVTLLLLDTRECHSKKRRQKVKVRLIER